MSYTYDLHIHTHYSSDGIMSPKELVERAIKKSLNGIAVTDHNTINGGVAAKKYETKDFKVIIGSEIKTDRGEIIGLFLKKEIKPNKFQTVVKEIKKQKGLVIVPHPFDRLRKAALHPTSEDVKFIDAIETFNSRIIFKEDTKKAISFAREHNLPIVAGSDAHFKNEIGKAGIIIPSPDLRKALLRKENRVFSTHSSFLNHGGTKLLNLWRRIKSG